MEPATTGGLAALAISLMAEALVHGTVGEAAKDAYHALKGKIAVWAASDLEALENAPTSASRQAVIAEEVDRQSHEHKIAIQSLARALIDELEQGRGGGSVGIDIGRLQAAQVHLKKIDVTGGRGIVAEEVTTPGDFVVDALTVGRSPGKLKR